MNWFRLVHDRNKGGAVANMVMNYRVSSEAGNFFNNRVKIGASRRNILLGGNT